MIDAKIPAGPLDDKWTEYKGHCKLVNPANKRKLEVIIIGTGVQFDGIGATLRRSPDLIEVGVNEEANKDALFFQACDVPGQRRP